MNHASAPANHYSRLWRAASPLQFDRLARAKSRPAVIADAVRSALREAVAWRMGGGAAPSDAALINAAVACGRLKLDAQTDSAERSRTLGAVQRAAGRFAGSSLCRRLMSVPTAQFLPLPHAQAAADVVVRDRRRRLHAIVLTPRSDGLEAARVAGRVAAETEFPAADQLTPVMVHVYALASGTRRTFVREASKTAGFATIAHVA